MNNQKENSGIHTKEKEEHKEQLMLNCSLCGKKLFAKESSDIIIETISASKYHFDSPQCAMMFKRLNHVYGENLKNFMGTSQFIADPFWDKTIPTEAEIKEINQETNKPDIKVITNREEALKTSLKLVKNGKNEILLLFSSANAFYRRYVGGDGLDIIKEIFNSAKEIKIRILTPFDEKITDFVDNLKNSLKIDIKYLPEPLQLKVTIIVVDRSHSMAVELINDNVDNSIEAMGLSTYSNSKSTVLYYVSIFESLWKQADIYKKAEDLYSQLKYKNETQRQFLNIAAHELRNPIQPILGLAEVMLSNKNLNVIQQEELLRIIVNNAKKLHFLTNNLLDIARIDENLFTLDLQELDIVKLTDEAINEIRSQITDKKIKIILKSDNDSIDIIGDKIRLNQVFLNLVNNSIKYSNEGDIVISIKRISNNSNNSKNKNNSNSDDVLIQIKDKGLGIPPAILQKLFLKFTKGSKAGTGLGLFICKNIVEGHGGKIWAENNTDKGATFSFTIPTKPNSSNNNT
ncbi:MAG TPA: HAMP domain-containing sensor histidine kinase [Nitrososphaeraceae archaeon]|nr:HAMP domain-containing sensor histidine kinase [Nitrososphaeraceae archaeon]